jgi:RarD protein
MKGKIKLISAMLIYGSIGIFVRQIKLPAIHIAFLRACVGSCFLLTLAFIKDINIIKNIFQKKMLIYLCSGALLGINWYFLFKAFEYTTISSAILIYYLAPIIVIGLSPFILSEPLTGFKVLCMILALIGLFLVILDPTSISTLNTENFMGIIYALAAAIFYASVILINKRSTVAGDLEITIVQLLSAAGALIPILIIQGETINLDLLRPSLWQLLTLGILHTGIAYLLYFSSIKVLEGQTVAVYCYIDPISTMVFATLFLGEQLSLLQITGGILILSASYLIDKPRGKKQVVMV